jgi:uncharacterized protein
MKLKTNSDGNFLAERILKFILSQNQFVLATCVNGKPHCAICFYAYSEKLNSLIFKSKSESLHVVEGIANKEIAAAITNSQNRINEIKGAQIEGIFIKPDVDQIKEARQNYYKKFPFALAIPGEIWLIELTKVKFTDNSLGFAQKIIWIK